MLRHFVEASLRFRGVVIALACLAAGYGLYTALHARYDVFPEFAPPQVIIQTEAPGLSPEEVEQLVTRPVESAVNGVGGLERMASQSIQGLSVVTVTFADTTDVYRARQLVGESLTQVVGRLPEGVAAPVMAPLTSSTSTVLTIGLTWQSQLAGSDTRSPASKLALPASKLALPVDVRALADWTLRPRLLGVKGVSKVAVFGGEVRQLQVQIRPERLAALGVSLAEVLESARRATGVRGAGFVESANQRVIVRTEGQALTAAELGECVVRRGDQQAGLASQQAGLAGGLVRLRDVADVVEGAEPRFGAATVMGKPGVVLTISSQYGANTMEVTEALDAALAELRPTLEAEGVRLHASLFRPANFIADAIGNVRASLLLGGGLVAVVLFLFLFNVRTAFISLTAIPLSLLVAVAVLTHLGLTLNTLTLGGLAIAIGEVVDDAIIDVENIHRRLRQPREGRSAFRIVLEASLEVRGAVIYATLVVAMVFLPVLTMSGIQGKLFAPPGLAYVLATLASLVVALTLTPALALVLLPASRACQPGAWQGQPSNWQGQLAGLALPVAGAHGAGEPPFSRWMKSRYGAMLAGAMRRPRLLVGSALGLCVAAAAAIPFFGGAFLPELREGHFILHMSAVAGTSLDESLRIGGKVTEELLRNPHIRSVAQQAGRAELGDDVFGPHYSEFQVDLVPLKGEEGELVQSEIRDSVARFPGLYFAIKPFLTERIEETVSGEMAAVAVKVFGDDLDAMDRTAARVAEVLSSVAGHADVKADPPPAQLPLMVVRLRPDRLKLFGLAGLDVLDAVQTAYQGTEVGRTYEGNRVTDVTVVLRDADRPASWPCQRDPEGISRLLLRDARGGLLRLGEVADVFPSTGRYSVAHEAARRKVTVTCNVRGRDLASFVAEARSRVAREVEVPAGVQAPVFSGAEEAESAARREILLYSIVSAVGIVLLLSIVYRSGRNLLLVLANVPFALVGGVMAVFLTGGWLSVGSLVGFVTLFGITTRNSIMLISHYEHLVREEGMAWGLECAVRGALERLSPILMTAMVTGLGLLPIAIGTGDPGREIEGPMALVILGGLVTSTALNLLVLPTLALRFARFETRAAEETT